MDKESLLKKIATGVKVANGAQTTSDVISELGKLDVDLPWRKRVDVPTENEIEQTTEQPVTEKSSLVKNVLIGGTLGAIFLFFSKRSKASKNLFDEQLTVSTDMQLTKNFRLSEFLVSSEIPEIKEYKLSKGELRNVTRVAIVLQKIRDEYGESIFINSGGRPAALTARDGKYKGLNLVQILTEKGYSPASHSQHMDFSAADFTVTDKEELPILFALIRNMSNSPNYSDIINQSIIYIEDGKPNFIHLGVSSDLGKFAISSDNKFLIANTTLVDSKRSTKFYSFTKEKLDEFLG